MASEYGPGTSSLAEVSTRPSTEWARCGSRVIIPCQSDADRASGLDGLAGASQKRVWEPISAIWSLSRA